MKLAAIALASALASVGFIQPGFAQGGNQNDRGQSDQQYGPGPQNQFRGDMNRSQDTTGQAQNWSQDEGSRRGDRSDSDEWHGGMGMQGRMGPIGPRLRERLAQRRGAGFFFSNGRARMAVRCPVNESIDNCVRAASQLLDKITSLRGGFGRGSTSGSGLGFGNEPSGTATPQNQGGSDNNNSSGQEEDDED